MHGIWLQDFHLQCTKNIYFLLADAEFEVVIMGNRHNPTKCIALGKWDEPGTE